MNFYPFHQNYSERFLNNFVNDISILEYEKVDIESRSGIEYKFVRFPKMQMRDSADIEFAVFDSPKPFHEIFCL